MNAKTERFSKLRALQASRAELNRLNEQSFETNDHNTAFLAGRFCVELVEYNLDDSTVYAVAVYDDPRMEFYSRNYDHFNPGGSNLIEFFSTESAQDALDRFFEAIKERTHINTLDDWM